MQDERIQSNPGEAPRAGEAQRPLPLLLGIHCHQPEGNFASVLERAYDDAYAPFLEMLEEFPRVRLSLHYTGTLYEFFEAKHPEFLERLAALVRRGQVELLGGGWFEPILSAIPERDAIGQVERMAQELERLFGVRPAGAWLAERVWEPALPSLLARAGVRYTILDETHFRYAGLSGDEILGHYITEKRGDATLVVPIDKGLRYLIPFRGVDEVLAHLRATHARTGGRFAITYADDGEKFGVWPGTREWVYEKGWLREFFAAISEAGWIECVPIGEYVGRAEPRGRIYLPAASYDEMTEWALPVATEIEFEKILAEKKSWPGGARLDPFLRGGFWDNFLAKYPESNQLHKRMLRASAAVARAAEKVGNRKHARLARARDLLYRAQVNCPYWHGIFGGLYLNYLRAHAYSNMIAAETIADEIVHGRAGQHAREVADFDRDGHPEITLSNRTALVIVAPRRGGAIVEWDSRQPAVNVSDVLARRREAYHQKLLETAQAASKAEPGAANARPASERAETTTSDRDEPRSIHDIEADVSADLLAHLVEDGGPRGSLCDRVLARGATLDALARAERHDLARLDAIAYEWRLDPGDDAGVVLATECALASAGGEIAPDVIATAVSEAASVASPGALAEAREDLERWAGEGGASVLADVAALQGQLAGQPRTSALTAPPPAFASRPRSDAPAARSELAVAPIPEPATARLAIEKRVRLAAAENAIVVDYALRHAGGGAIDTRFATELNLTLHAGDAEDRYIVIDGARPQDARLASKGAALDVARVELVDGWRGITVAVEIEPRAEVWRYPVMTVSRSESGFELNYQGTCLLVVVPLVLGKGDSLSFRMTLSIRKGPERSAPKKTSVRQRSD